MFALIFMKGSRVSRTCEWQPLDDVINYNQKPICGVHRGKKSLILSLLAMDCHKERVEAFGREVVTLTSHMMRSKGYVPKTQLLYDWILSLLHDNICSKSKIICQIAFLLNFCLLREDLGLKPMFETLTRFNHFFCSGPSVS